MDVLERENNILKKILADSNEPCIYCGLAREDWNNCVEKSCRRSEDTLTNEFGIRLFDTPKPVFI